MGGEEKREKPKSFLRRHEIPIIIALTFFFIYVVVFLNQKVNFFLGNELIVFLTPGQKSISMHYSNQSFVSFEVSVENSANCRALCGYSFYDRSKNTALDSGEFEISRGEYVRRTYNISARRAGSGQDIYSFDVECKSIASIICLTSSPKTQRSSLVTVNYDLSEEERQLKESLKIKITTILDELKDADESFQKLNQRYFELGKKINLEEISGDKTRIENEIDSTILEMEAIRSRWSLEDYRQIDSILDDTFLGEIQEIKSSINNLNSKIDLTVQIHNNMLDSLSTVSSKINTASKNANSLGKNDEYDISILVSEFNRISNELTNNTFENYSVLSSDVNVLVGKTQEILLEQKNETFDLFNEINYFAYYEEKIICSMIGCAYAASPGDVLIYNADRFLDDYPSRELMCDLLSSTDKRLENTREPYSAFDFPSTSEFLDNAKKAYENKKRIENTSIISYFESNYFDSQDVEPYIMDSFSKIIPSSKTELGDANESEEVINYILSKINFSDAGKYEELNNACMRYYNPAYRIQSFDFSHVLDDVSYTITEKINTTLPENPPICCVFNECNPCCSSEQCKSQNYPVIFLHGHSFSSDNSPEFSLDAFNKIQSRMQDDGYINAGIVSIYSKNEDSKDGAWGFSGRPVTVKASYYYDAIMQDGEYVVVPTKSESIDTYSLRLKDIVDVVKQRTGKDKVDIVAHSMGGLVARKYLQIFGDNDVNKLVMIAAPNKGIGGRATDFCSLAGENLECRDMSKNSIFISKLNDPSKQPKNTIIYNIIGTGCKMKTGEGDGVFLAEDVELENANNFYIDGKCTGLFGETLHTEILNVDKYNATYERIRDFLKN